MQALSAFLHMGGYGGYVWSAYAIAAIVLVLNVLLPQRAETAALRQLQQRHRTLPDHDAET